jgi:hypothetical protein
MPPSMRVVSSNLSVVGVGPEGEHEAQSTHTAVCVIEPNVLDGNVTGCVAEVDKLFCRSQR